MSYVYVKSGTSLYKVGFYAPDGEWQSDNDFGAADLAAKRVAYLNGGGQSLELSETVKQLEGWLTNLERNVIELRLAVFAAPAPAPDPMVTAVLAIATELKNIAAELEIANGKNF